MPGRRGIEVTEGFNKFQIPAEEVETMAVPKKKTSKSKRDKRRSHHALVLNQAIEECPKCHETKLLHRVCQHCGYYRGKDILKLPEE